MKRSPVYIQSIQQISVQQPLSDIWIKQPILYDSGYHRAIDPDFRNYFSMNESRRMGRLLKRAVLTSRQAIERAEIQKPDAIITSTGLGCVESTETLMSTLDKEDETTLKPACFMQSTHNMIGSIISIDLGCYGYNITYSHKEFSFASALEDAFIRLTDGSVNNVLVGAYDEVTPDLYAILQKTSYIGKLTKGFCSETAVSMVLGKERNAQTLCQIDGIKMLYRPTEEELIAGLENLLKSSACPLSLLDGVMTGINGNTENDEQYLQDAANLFGKIPLMHYKHLFGESLTSMALGFYTSVVCLSHHFIPSWLFINQEEDKRNIRHILLYHQSGKRYHTFILLSC